MDRCRCGGFFRAGGQFTLRVDVIRGMEIAGGRVLWKIERFWTELADEYFFDML